MKLLMDTGVPVYDKARQLGAFEITTGIAWTWANFFPSRHTANLFIKWLEENGYEHRGVYTDKSMNGVSVSVRFRKMDI